MAERWVASGGAERFRALVRSLAEAAAAPAAPPLLSWADEVRRTAAGAAGAGH